MMNRHTVAGPLHQQIADSYDLRNVFVARRSPDYRSTPLHKFLLCQVFRLMRYHPDEYGADTQVDMFSCLTRNDL